MVSQVLPPSLDRCIVCPNQLLDCDAYSRSGSAGDPLRWYISQPPKWGPLTSQRSRLPSDVRTNAPLRVPTSNRTRLIRFLPLGAESLTPRIPGESRAPRRPRRGRATPIRSPLSSTSPESSRALRARVEPLAREHHAGLRHLLVELPRRGDELFARQHARLRVLVGFHQQHKPHRRVSWRPRATSLPRPR